MSFVGRKVEVEVVEAVNVVKAVEAVKVVEDVEFVEVWFGLVWTERNCRGLANVSKKIHFLRGNSESSAALCSALRAAVCPHNCVRQCLVLTKWL